MDNNKMKQIFFMVNDINQKNKDNLTLSKSMGYVAEKSNLNRQTVKSYYYKTLKYLNENPVIAKSLNIKLPKKKEFELFSKNEKETLFEKINKNKQNGISVRHTCFDLSHGDAKLMLRLENKYRSMKRAVDKKENGMKENIFTSEKNENKKNIINITSAKKSLQKKLTDSDISALFSGLLNLVKKSIYEKVSKDFEKENREANDNFRQTIIEVEELEAKLKKEQQKNLDLASQIENQKMQICKLIKNMSKTKMKV